LQLAMKKEEKMTHLLSSLRRQGPRNSHANAGGKSVRHWELQHTWPPACAGAYWVPAFAGMTRVGCTLFSIFHQFITIKNTPFNIVEQQDDLKRS